MLLYVIYVLTLALITHPVLLFTFIKFNYLLFVKMLPHRYVFLNCVFLNTLVLETGTFVLVFLPYTYRFDTFVLQLSKIMSELD
jgi:uncharacterized membrane protein